MRRACHVTLKFATASKRRQIAALLEAHRAAVNFYIRSLWNEPGRLDQATLARLQRTRLSERYKSQALKQAIEIVTSTRKAAQVTGRRASVPAFRGAAILDAKFVSVEPGRGSFDLVVRLSVLNKGKRITIPTRGTAVLNQWLSRPGARLIQGCALTEDALMLWVEVPDAPPKEDGEIVGLDLGVSKLITLSDGQQPRFFGMDFKRVRDKIRRRKPGSMRRRRALAERDQLIHRVLNQLPWKELRVVGIEALHDMKRGKQKGRGKPFRKALAPWTYRRVLERLGHKAEENRVLLVAVPPAHTSRECPACGTVSNDNRRGEDFRCVGCGYTADADFVGATNVLARTLATLRSVESLRLRKAV